MTRFPNGTPGHDHLGDILAIPKLLDMLAIEGAIVTVDAMGCQRGACPRARPEDRAEGDRQQGRLRARQKAAGFKDTGISRGETIDGDHGRIETRTTTVIHDVVWPQRRHDWPGPKAVVVVESTREGAGQVEQPTRFHITSLLLAAPLLGPITRRPTSVPSGTWPKI